MTISLVLAMGLPILSPVAGVDPVGIARDLVFGPPGEVELLATRANADGSQWSVILDRDPGERRDDFEALAEVLADQAVRVYDRMIGQNTADCATGPNPLPGTWGLELRDADCDLTIHLQGSEDTSGPAYASGNASEVLIRFWVRGTDILPALGWYVEPGISQEEIVYSILGHELFHHVQFLGGSFMPQFVTEGQARFVETLLAPELNDRASSAWYSTVSTTLDPLHESRNGVNGWANHPDLKVCQRSYDAGLLWGYVYDTYGGFAALKDVWGKARYYFDECDVPMYSAFDAAIRSASNGADGAGEALLGAGVAAELGDLSWSAPDHGPAFEATRFLVPIERQSIVTDHADSLVFRSRNPTSPILFWPPGLTDTGTAENAGHYWTGSGGLQYVELPAGVPMDVIVTADDPDWRHAAIVRDASGAATVVPLPLGEPVTVDAPAGGDAVLVAARAAPVEGWFGVALSFMT